MNPAPHILQLIETVDPGGAERVLINLARCFKSSGTNVSSGLLREGWLSRQLATLDIPTHMLSLQHTVDVPFLWSLMRLVRRERINLIHSHEFYMNLYGSLAGRLLGVPVVATVHGRNHYSSARHRVYAMRYLGKLGATVVAVSSDIRNFLENSLGLKDVRVIPNGIDVAAYSGMDRLEVRRSLGFGAGEKVVGAVGNLLPVKGHALLLNAVARLQDPDVHIVIAGQGEEEGRLRELTERLSLNGRVHLLGFREDVPRLLSAFDVYALPSFSEGQSLSLMEAMSAGLPVIAGRVGGNPELIREGESGFLFETGSEEDLASKVKILLGQSSVAKDLGARARERAGKEFSLNAMVNRYRNLYAEKGLEFLPG